jgi:uncharacterized membrane protein YcaP (DUF421 family)
MTDSRNVIVIKKGDVDEFNVKKMNMHRHKMFFTLQENQ